MTWREQVVTSVAGIFAVWIFAVRFFAIWIFCRTELSPYKIFAVKIFSQYGNFAVRSFHRMKFSPYGIFAVLLNFMGLWCFQAVNSETISSIYGLVRKLNLFWIQEQPWLHSDQRALPVYGTEKPTCIHTYIDHIGRDEWLRLNVVEVECSWPVMSCVKPQIFVSVRRIWFWLVLTH